MFESNQFYHTDAETGIVKLTTDPETMVYYNFILVMACIILFGSLLYYFTVLLAEVVGHVPMFVRKACAGKKSYAQKHIAAVGDGDGHEDDDQIEMAEIGNANFRNPMAELERAKQTIKDNDQRQKEMERLNKESENNQKTLLEQMKRLKQQNMIHTHSRGRDGTSKPIRRVRTTKTKKEMAPQKVIDSDHKKARGFNNKDTNKKRTNGRGGAVKIRKKDRLVQAKAAKNVDKKRRLSSRELMSQHNNMRK
jgi:hypothetical protein